MLHRKGWLLFLLVWTPAALAQQRYELKPRFTVGQKWAENRVSTFEMATAVKIEQQVVEQSRQKSRETYVMEWEVLAVANGKPSAARIAFGPACGAEMEQNGQTQSMKFPAAGATIEARLRPDGGVDIQPASANVPEVIAVLEEMFDPEMGAYPKQPLAVGESWSWDKRAVAESFGLSPEDEGDVTCTLKAVSMRGGRETAEVAFSVRMKKGEAQESQDNRVATLTESNLTGVGFIDVAAGRLVEFNLSGPVVVSGIIYARDYNGQLAPQADLDGNGRMSIESHAKLLGETGGQPLAGVGEVDFTGEYANPEITLTLAKSVNGFDGKLHFGDQEFPVRARVQAGALKGEFQSGGNWFDFNAALTQNVLSLTTGGKTHSLNKKITAQNPLGATTPSNPLGGTQPPNSLGGGGETPMTGAAAWPSNAPSESGGSTSESYAVYRCLDERGFRDPAGRPLEVFRMLMPQGWRFTGGVEWKINQKDVRQLSRVDLVNPATLRFRVSSPGDEVVLEAYPEVHFADLRGSPAYEMGGFPRGSDYAGFVVHETMDPVAYITDFVIPQQRGMLQNARIVESKNLPSMAGRYDREAAIMTQSLQAAGAGSISHAAAQVTVDYDLNGRAYREVFVVALGYIQTPGITMWSSRLNLSARAPREQAERWKPVVATILGSVEFNMRWIGELLKIQKQAEGVIVDVDRFCQKVDAEITANRAETNAQIQRDMYPRLAPFCDHTGTDGKRYFLETDKQHQMNEQGLIRSGLTLPDQEGWTRMPEYTGG